jgi:hypothetical protein
LARHRYADAATAAMNAADAEVMAMVLAALRVSTKYHPRMTGSPGQPPGDHDIDGLATPCAVMGDSATPPVQPDQVIEQCQAPAGLVFAGCLLPNRPPAWGVVVDFHPQVTAGERHADMDHPSP